MLDFLGVELESNEAAPHEFPRLVIWRSNQLAFDVFVRVSRHGQWLRNPSDPRQILSIDGSYLLNYVKSTLTDLPDIAEFIDDVFCIVDGWLKGHAESQEE